MPSFQHADGTFFAISGHSTTANPSSGATIVMDSRDRVLFVGNSSLLASLTILLPLGCDPGETVELGFESGITNLAVKDGLGNVVASAPTTANGPGDAIVLKFINKTYGWYYWK